MAEGQEGSSDCARFLCSICLEDFTNPKLLPCFHTLCLLCLESYVERAKTNNNFDCPLCRVSTAIPPGGVGQFQANFYIPLPPRTELADLLCDICDNTSGKKAGHKCLDCDELLCETCFQYHTKMKATREHNLISLPSSGNDASFTGKIQASYFCKRHPKEEIKMACIDCDESLCIVCKLTNHENHNTKDVKDMAIETRKELTGLAAKVDTDMKQTASDIDTINMKIKLVNTLKDSNVEKVEKQAKLYIKMINEIKDKLMKEIEEKHKSDLNKLEARLSDLDVSQTTDSQLAQMAKCIEETADDAAVVSLGAQFKQSLKQSNSMKPDVHKAMNIPQVSFTSAQIPEVSLGVLELQKQPRRVKKYDVSKMPDIADVLKQALRKKFPEDQAFLNRWLTERRWPECDQIKPGAVLSSEQLGIDETDYKKVSALFNYTFSKKLFSSLDFVSLAGELKKRFVLEDQANETNLERGLDIILSSINSVNLRVNGLVVSWAKTTFKIKTCVFVCAQAISMLRNASPE